MRNPALGRFRRLTSFAVLALALVAPALPVVADPVPVKGKSGTVVEFEIVEVTKEGFRGTRSGSEAVILVKWEQVDLDWLKENQPDLHQKMVDAAAAEPAPAPGAADAAAPADPATVAKELIKSWNTRRVPSEQNRNNQGRGGGGGRNRDRNGQGGNNGGGNNNNRANNTPQPTIFAFLKLLDGNNEAGRAAYERLETDQEFRKTLVGQVETALSQLRKARTPDNARVVEPLLATGNSFVEAMNEIGSSSGQISRSAVSGVARFLDRWQSVGEAK